MDIPSSATPCRSEIICKVERDTKKNHIKIDLGEYGVFEAHFSDLQIYIAHYSDDKYKINITSTLRSGFIDKKAYPYKISINLLIKKIYNFVDNIKVLCHEFDEENNKVVLKKIDHSSTYNISNISSIHYAFGYRYLFLFCVKNLGIYACINGVDSYNKINKIRVLGGQSYVFLYRRVQIPGDICGADLLPSHGYTPEIIINAFKKILLVSKKLPNHIAASTKLCIEGNMCARIDMLDITHEDFIENSEIFKALIRNADLRNLHST